METLTDTIEPNAMRVRRDRLAQDVRVLVKDAEELLKATGNDLSDKANEARSRLMATLDKAKATCHELEEKARVGAKMADQVIRGHPYQSIGVAFGVGLLIGVLVNRR